MKKAFLCLLLVGMMPSAFAIGGYGTTVKGQCSTIVGNCKCADMNCKIGNISGLQAMCDGEGYSCHIKFPDGRQVAGTVKPAIEIRK